MKVILLKTVDKIGAKHDVKDVADGFARNFLFPKGLARPATEGAIKEIEAEKAAAEAEAELDLAKTEELVAAIDGQEVEIKAKASDDGTLYGAITPMKISKILQDKGFKVKKNQIKLEDNIKEAGEHDVTLDLAHGLEAKIKLIVVPGESKEGLVK